jgi:hypothetical protein
LQLYVCRINQAIQINPEYVNKALDYINNKFKIKLPVLHNTTIVFGIGGAGKSAVVAKFTAGDGANTWISGPVQQQINNLKNNGLSKATGITADELIKKIIGNDDFATLNKDIDNGVEGKFYKQTNGTDKVNTYKLKDITFNDIPNKPKVIVLDEATHIPNVKI